MVKIMYMYVKYAGKLELIYYHSKLIKFKFKID